MNAQCTHSALTPITGWSGNKSRFIQMVSIITNSYALLWKCIPSTATAYRILAFVLRTTRCSIGQTRNQYQFYVFPFPIVLRVHVDREFVHLKWNDISSWGSHDWWRRKRNMKLGNERGSDEERETLYRHFHYSSGNIVLRAAYLVDGGNIPFSSKLTENFRRKFSETICTIWLSGD